MNQQQLLLTQLLGSKELTFGCLFRLPGDTDIHKYVDDDNFVLPNGIVYIPIVEKKKQIIGHPATLSDLHRWMNGKFPKWCQGRTALSLDFFEAKKTEIKYDSSKDLLNQSPETLDKIIKFITNTK